MKKLLVVLLAVVMIFGFAATAMAADTQIPDYSDKPATDAGGVAVYRLTALKVLDGDGWGKTYRWSDGLTRGELAKIVCFLYMGEDAKDEAAIAATLGANKYYKDIPANYWGVGYINLATAKGLMKGMGAGMFAPTRVVTMQEVVTVTLRSLGYTDNLPGGPWPNNYITKAVNTTLVKYVDFIPNQDIAREDLGIIFNNALDMYIVDYVGTNAITTGLGYLIGSVDKDGFAYRPWSTNEEDNLRKFAGLLGIDFSKMKDKNYTFDYGLEFTTLGYKVFEVAKLPVQFDWDLGESTHANDLLESFGWYYEDFDKDELGFYFESGKINDAYGVDVASDYYIWQGDLVDLGGRTANVTYYVGKNPEAVFVELTGSVEYDDEIKKDEYAAKNIWGYPEDADAWYDFIKELLIPGAAAGNAKFGEVIYDADGDIAAFDDYTNIVARPFGIVDKVSNGKVTFDSYESPATLKAPFTDGIQIADYQSRKASDDGNDVFYCMSCQDFIDPETLEFGDVVYYAGYLEDKADLWLVYEPAETVLSKIGQDFLYLDGVKTFAQYENSFASADNGGKWFYYDDIYRDLFTESAIWASSYVPSYFAYISDDLLGATEGVITKFGYTTDRFGAVTYNSVTILYKDGKEYTYDLDPDARQWGNFIGYDWVDNNMNWILEGSLVNLNLKDGKVYDMTVAVHWGGEDVNFMGGTLWQDTWFSDGVGPVVIDVVNKAQRILEITGINEDKYNNYVQIASDAVIYDLSSKQGRWPAFDVFDEASILSVEDFLNNASQYMLAYAYTEDAAASVLYIVDKDEHDLSDFMALLDGKETYFTVSGGTYSVEIGDKVYPITKGAYEKLADLLRDREYGVLVAANMNDETTGHLAVIDSVEDAAYLDSSDGAINNKFKLYNDLYNEGKEYGIYYGETCTRSENLLTINGTQIILDLGAEGTVFYDCVKKEEAFTDKLTEAGYSLVAITKDGVALYVLKVAPVTVKDIDVSENLLGDQTQGQEPYINFIGMPGGHGRPGDPNTYLPGTTGYTEIQEMIKNLGFGFQVIEPDADVTQWNDSLVYHRGNTTENKPGIAPWGEPSYYRTKQWTEEVLETCDYKLYFMIDEGSFVTLTQLGATTLYRGI